MLGVWMVVAWAAITGAKDVGTSYVVQSLHPLLLSLILGLVSFCGFGALNYQHFGATLQKAWTDRKLVICLTVTTLIIWVAATLALKFLEPAVSAVVALGVTPLTTTLLSSWLRPLAKRTVRDWLSSIGIIFGVAFLVFNSLGGLSGLGSQPWAYISAGFFCATLTGTSIATSTYFAKGLYDLGWKPVQVLFVRVWLVVPVLAVYVLAQIDVTTAAYWSPANIKILLALGLFGSLLPTYFSQSSLKLLEPLVYSKLICLLPIFTLLFQYFDGRIQFSMHTVVGVFIILLFVIYGARPKRA